MIIRGVLFDVDDTLVDTRTAFAAAVSAVAERFLPHVRADRHADLVAAWRRDDGGYFRAYTRGELDFRGQRHARANHLHLAFGGRPLDRPAFDVWTAIFEEALGGAWRAHHDAAAAVADIGARGLAIGALSNSEVSYQERKLARSGLGHVRLLVGLDTLGVGKPDPRVFHEACRRLGTEPAETVYVGDELDVDARAAVQAGLVGVWLDRPGSRRGGSFEEDDGVARAAGVHVIPTLTGLLDLF